MGKEKMVERRGRGEKRSGKILKCIICKQNVRFEDKTRISSLRKKMQR
jgi:hypothetical protein